MTLIMCHASEMGRFMALKKAGYTQISHTLYQGVNLMVHYKWVSSNCTQSNAWRAWIFPMVPTNVSVVRGSVWFKSDRKWQKHDMPYNKDYTWIEHWPQDKKTKLELQRGTVCDDALDDWLFAPGILHFYSTIKEHHINASNNRQLGVLITVTNLSRQEGKPIQ